MIDRICEEFGCLPSEAVRELDEDPEQLVLALLDVRPYLKCKAAYDASPDEAESPLLDPWRDTETLDLVREHTRDAVMSRMPKRANGDLGRRPRSDPAAQG